MDATPAALPQRRWWPGRFRITSVQVLVGILLLGLACAPLLTRLGAASTKFQAATTIFVSVFVQAMPFLVLGVLVSGAIAAFVSPALLQRVLPDNTTGAICVAGVAGMAIPGCECGAVPASRRLIDQGAASAAALTFMLAAPAINPVVLVATAVAFAGEPAMVAARFTGSLATALITGAIWARIGRPGWLTPRPARHDHDTHGTKWHVFTEAARHDLLQAGSFLVLGAAAATALRLLVPPSVYDTLTGSIVAAILVCAALAVILALCSEADAFVAASMSALPLLPRLVFLVVGPAVDVKLFAMQAGSFGRPFALRFAPLTLLVAVGCGTLAGLIFLGGVR
ncbi:permease [Nocardia grenadensis]